VKIFPACSTPVNTKNDDVCTLGFTWNLSTVAFLRPRTISFKNHAKPRYTFAPLPNEFTYEKHTLQNYAKRSVSIRSQMTYLYDPRAPSQGVARSPNDSQNLLVLRAIRATIRQWPDAIRFCVIASGPLNDFRAKRIPRTVNPWLIGRNGESLPPGCQMKP